VLQGFTIRTIYLGTYKIDVTQGSRAVRGSPYYCQVYDASKVKIEDVGSKSVAVNEKIAFRRKYLKTCMPRIVMQTQFQNRLYINIEP
jgi:hypothetical protein